LGRRVVLLAERKFIFREGGRLGRGAHARLVSSEAASDGTTSNDAGLALSFWQFLRIGYIDTPLQERGRRRVRPFWRLRGWMGAARDRL
jgi:hypothetical protein